MSVSIIIQQACEDQVPEDSVMRGWVETALSGQAAEGELVIRIVDAAESRALNVQYRNKDKPTNVLSFPAEALPVGIPELAAEQALGDLVVCASVVADEAREQNKLLDAHWAHMLIHGCLHLLGYDHIEADQAERMEALERKLLAKLNFSDPYE